MTTRTRDTGDSTPEYTTVGPDAPAYDRYAATTLEGDLLLVYDRDDEDAWVKSDAVVDLDEAA